jgi:hypothetical protein
MADSFSNSADAVSAPARRAAAVTPSDSVALTDIPKALYVGRGGTLVARGVDDAADVSFVNVGAGAILPIRARYVRATGTSAGDIVALY